MEEIALWGTSWLHTLLTFPADLIMKNVTGFYVACVEKRRDGYRVKVGRPGGKIPLGRPRCRGENNIGILKNQLRGSRVE
jgi:hypothetical protein